MNKKFVKKSKKINDIKNHLKSLDPTVEKVDILVDRSPEKKFRSRIIVKAKNKPVLVAKKVASTYSSSLLKSEKAIIKQIDKYKTKLNRNLTSFDDVTLFM